MSKKVARLKTGNPYISTTNACKLCKPLGACIAFRGIEGMVPFLHGSQGCATYMRRYIISHFREPIDIASSSMSEKHAVYGGGPNLKLGIDNVINKYSPRAIGVATTCLAETIGDDVPMLLREWRVDREEAAADDNLPAPTLVNVSTPSYSGTHMEGFHAVTRGAIAQLATELPESVAIATETGQPALPIALLPGMVSPADIRYLKTVMGDFGLRGTVLPDISESLDAPALREYEKVPRGGTPIAEIRALGGTKGTVEFGRVLARSGETGGQVLAERFEVPLHPIGMPIGLRESDRLFDAFAALSGRPVPRQHALERGQLIDAYVDGHKYLYGKRAIVYGEEDLVVGLTAFLAEIGIQPVLCASGGDSGYLHQAIAEVVADLLPEPPQVRDDVDFFDIANDAETLAPDLIVGNSKGYPLARKLNIPLIRVGFPIHDRFGAQRILHVGYRGTQNLFDRIVNSVIDKKQNDSPIGYSYL